MDALAPTAELSGLIRAGHLRSAGEWLVSHYAADVVSFCRSWVRERELAEDLAQDVFSAAFSSLRGFRGEASPRTWLLSIARNRCIDHTRRQKREPFEIASDESDQPDARADDGPLPAELLVNKTSIEAALGELEEGDRALVVLRFRHGLEYPELASVFGLREGTVRMRLSRALGRMRHALERRESVPTPPLPGSVAGPLAAPPARASAATGAPRPAPAAPEPPPAGAPPPAFGAPPRPAAAAPRQRAGLLATIRRWLLPLPPSAPISDFGRALTPYEPDVSERMVGKLESLVGSLPPV